MVVSHRSHLSLEVVQNPKIIIVSQQGISGVETWGLENMEGRSTALTIYPYWLEILYNPIISLDLWY